MKKRFDLTKKQFLIFAVCAVVLRLLLTAFQRVILTPEITMIDDFWMYDSAVSIVNGEWLGPYTHLTMAKHMLFSVWLALVHWSGISYLLAGHLLSVAACLVLAGACAPMIKNKLLQLSFLVFLLFCPALYADYTLRVYRDNITISFFLLVFAGVIGIALRWKEGKTAALLSYGVIGGVSLGSSYLLREDGYWLFPFVVVGFAVTVYFIVRHKAKKKLVKIGSMMLFFVIFGIGILAYSSMNYRYYGRFIVSDFTSREYRDAVAALIRIGLVDEDNLYIPVSAEARDLLYEASPAFAELEQYMDDSAGMDWWKRARGDGALDYTGGGIHWSLREAASRAGYYETSFTAKAFYERMTAELNAAYDSGELPSVTGERSSLSPPLRSIYILPTLKETGVTLYWAATYKAIDNSPALSYGPPELLAEMARFLNCDALLSGKQADGGTRIQLWAISETGAVNVYALDRGGEIIPAERTLSTGGDVFIRMMKDGVMAAMPNGCRIVLHMPGDQADTVRLVSGDVTLDIPVRKMDRYAQEKGIYYRIEAVGDDFTEMAPEYGTVELFLYRAMRLLVWVYRVLTPVALLAAIFLIGRRIGMRVMKKEKFNPGEAIGFWVTIGILFSALERIGIVAFIEVGFISIGTYPMYFSVAYPLLTAFCFLCFSFAKMPIRLEENNNVDKSGAD